MGTKRALERRLSVVEPFERPRIDLEQYATPADVAAHLIHLADVTGDLADRVVVDLGTGTGVFALGAATRSPRKVIGLERDPAALARARENERRVDPPRPVEWVRADAMRAPLCLADATVVMNPPFGAQRGNEHADRAFLETARSIGRISYSIHNEGSRSFVESYVEDADGEVTHAYEVAFDLDRQFEFHESDRETIRAECYRIRWSGQ